MDTILVQAYKIIMGSNPAPGMADWEIARAILEGFDVSKTGETLAKECIFRIVNHIVYPSKDLTTQIVGRAELFASELWSDLGDEPHMADIERKEYMESLTRRSPLHKVED